MLGCQTMSQDGKFWATNKSPDTAFFHVIYEYKAQYNSMSEALFPFEISFHGNNSVPGIEKHRLSKCFLVCTPTESWL